MFNYLPELWHIYIYICEIVWNNYNGYEMWKVRIMYLRRLLYVTKLIIGLDMPIMLVPNERVGLRSFRKVVRSRRCTEWSVFGRNDKQVLVLSIIIILFLLLLMYQYVDSIVRQLVCLPVFPVSMPAYLSMRVCLCCVCVCVLRVCNCITN